MPLERFFLTFSQEHTINSRFFITFSQEHTINYKRVVEIVCIFIVTELKIWTEAVINNTKVLYCFFLSLMLDIIMMQYHHHRGECLCCTELVVYGKMNWLHTLITAGALCKWQLCEAHVSLSSVLNRSSGFE